MSVRLTAAALVCAISAAMGCEAIVGLDDKQLEGAAGSTTTSGTGASAGSGGTTSGGAGGSGAGAGAAGGTGGTGTGGAPAGPTLLVAVEWLDQSSADGDILACSLAGGPPACQLLSPAGLPAQPFVIGWAPPGLIVVGARSRVVAVDSSSNTVAWSYSVGSGKYPIDVFPLQTPNGSLVAAAYENETGGGIRYLYAFDIGGNVVDSWVPTNSFIGSGYEGMTQQPADPSRLYALRVSSNVARRELDTVSESIVGDELATSEYLRTIHALHDGSRLRMAWVAGANYEDIHFLSTLGSVAGPIRCEVGGNPCRFAHVVPDPTDDKSYLALCGEANIIRQVVRLQEGDSASDPCEVLYDSATLGSDWRLSQLAIRP